MLSFLGCMHQTTLDFIHMLRCTQSNPIVVAKLRPCWCSSPTSAGARGAQSAHIQKNRGHLFLFPSASQYPGIPVWDEEFQQRWEKVEKKILPKFY
jgi:hypothetical protein